MVCENLDGDEKHCTPTFLNQFNTRSTRKPNFSWKCDPCATLQDNAQKTSMSLIVSKLATQMDTLTARFDDLKDELTSNQPTGPNQIHWEIHGQI